MAGQGELKARQIKPWPRSRANARASKDKTTEARVSHGQGHVSRAKHVRAKAKAEALTS